MADPMHDRSAAMPALAQVSAAAEKYLSTLDDRPILDPAALALVDRMGGPLPEEGLGTEETVARMIEVGTAAASSSPGPRFFHFVTGGATPAALAADWLTGLLDQNAVTPTASPFAHDVETVTIDWLRDLFGLPTGWGGALVGSATYANFTGLGCATHWWGERQGADTTANGLAGLPRMPVLSGGYVHASARKALQMLGHGRDTIQVYARDASGRADLEAMRRRLDSLNGAPAVLIGNVGDVNTGDFDPVDELADLAAEFNCWLHLDGAFGLFAALSPRTEHLTRGIERADSIACDGHKWLNVPYESGFAFVRKPERLGRAFGMPGAPYFPGAGYFMEGPDSSRRLRALPIWATLSAYGRDGYRAMVERHLDLAQHLGRRVSESPDLEMLAEVQVCIVCFRARPDGVPEEDLNDLNRKLAAELMTDGRVIAGGTVHEGRAALRPAIVNWRTTEADVDLLIDTVRDIADRLAKGN